MKAPWEEYATGSPSAPEAAAPEAAAPAPMDAAPAPAPAAGGAPWEEFAPAEPAPEDGLTGTVTDDGTTPDPYFGLGLPKDEAEMLANMRTLTEKGAAPNILRSYARESNWTLPQETEDWLDGPYAESLGAPNRTASDWVAGERPETSAPGAAWSGLKSGAMMGFDDEYQAAWGAGGNKIGQWLGLNATDAPIGDVYNQILQQNRAVKDAAYNDQTLAYGAGYVPGALLSAFATRGRGAPAETLWGRLAQSGAEGAKQGAMSGAGNADGGLGDRAMGALEGGAWGLPLGVLAHPLGAVIDNVVGRVGRAMKPRESNPMSGWDELGARAPQDPAAMRARAAEMEAAGVAPRGVDVVDESGRGVIRHAASEMTPGRQIVADDAQQVAADVQHRVRAAAREHISDNPNTARQIAEDITGPDGMPGAGTRGDNMEAAMAPVRGEVVPITDEIKSILGTREGQAALRGAEGLMTDPADRAIVRQVLAAARAKRVDAEDLFRKEVKGWDDLPEPVKAAYRAQRPELVSPDPWDGVELTVDMADKFARAMQGRATKTPGLERVTSAFSNAIRGEARAANPTYDDALNSYAAESGVAEAALGTGKFRGSSFLDDSADQFGSRVARADTNAPAASPLSELDALRVRARDEVSQKAGDDAGRGARGVARQLSQGAEQQTKNALLLGSGRKARALESRMAAEESRAANSEFINPNAGSKTNITGRDALVDGFADAVGNAGTAGWWGTIKMAARWLKQGGIRGIDAERLARDSISEDPARLSAAIDYLEQKGMARARATRFVNTLSTALAGRTGGAAVDDGTKAPPSVRSLYVTPTKQGAEQ